MKAYLDYYKILGVTAEATENEIKKAYRLLAGQFHPDRHYDQKTEEKAKGIFQDISEAYYILSDAKLRMEYDRLTHRRLSRVFRSLSPRADSSFSGIKKQARKKIIWTPYPVLNTLIDFVEVVVMLVILILPFAAPFILIFLFLMFFRH